MCAIVFLACNQSDDFLMSLGTPVKIVMVITTEIHAVKEVVIMNMEKGLNL